MLKHRLVVLLPSYRLPKEEDSVFLSDSQDATRGVLRALARHRRHACLINKPTITSKKVEVKNSRNRTLRQYTLQRLS